MMKKVLISCLTGFVLISKSSMTADIEVSLGGFENNQGQAVIVLHNKENTFPEGVDQAVAKISTPINNSEVLIMFKNIKPGTYAIAAIHDQNNNNELDKNFFGIPKEGVGTSADSKKQFGPPEFKDASFTLKDNKKIIINMDY